MKWNAANNNSCRTTNKNKKKTIIRIERKKMNETKKIDEMDDSIWEQKKKQSGKQGIYASAVRKNQVNSE